MRDRFPLLFENAILLSLEPCFQLDHQADIGLYLTKATALHNSSEWIGLKPSRITFSPISDHFISWLNNFCVYYNIPKKEQDGSYGVSITWIFQIERAVPFRVSSLVDWTFSAFIITYKKNQWLIRCFLYMVNFRLQEQVCSNDGHHKIYHCHVVSKEGFYFLNFNLKAHEVSWFISAIRWWGAGLLFFNALFISLPGMLCK